MPDDLFVGGDFEKNAFGAVADERVAVGESLGTGYKGRIEIGGVRCSVRPVRRFWFKRFTGSDSVGTIGVEWWSDFVDGRILT